MAILAVFMVVTIVVTGEAQELLSNTIQKCCPKGMQLGSKYTCVREEGREVSNETEEEFQPPVNKTAHYWIPSPIVQNSSIFVQYNTLATFETHFLSLNQYEISGNFTDLYSSVHPNLIKADQECFDTIVAGEALQRVRIKSLGVKPIFKCCQKGQRLNEIFSACESTSGVSEGEQKNEEKVSVSDSRQWLPGNYSHPFLLVKYNALHSTTFQFNYVIPERSLEWEVLSSFPTWNAMLLINGRDISGKNITGITNHFCFDEVMESSHTQRVLMAYIPHERVLYKCCPSGMHYDLATNGCVKRRVTYDLLQANIQKQLLFPIQNNMEYNWIPPSFLRSPSNTYTIYGALNDVRYHHVTVFLKNFRTIEYNNLQGIDLALVRKTVFCYEATINPFSSLIFINGFLTKPINKCCSFGERLNPQVNGCEPISEYTKEKVRDAEDAWFQPTQPWFPLNAPQSYYPVTSNYLKLIKKRYEFNIIETSKHHNDWKFISTNTQSSAIELRSQDTNKNFLSGSTDLYCFDEIKKGSTLSRVILAVIYHAIKCCPKGAQIDNTFQCYRRPGNTIVDINNEQIDWNDKHNDYWIPTSLRERNITVSYGDKSFSQKFKDGGMFTNESNWELVNNLNNIPTLLLYFTDLKGNKQIIKTQQFCFDYLLKVGKIAVYRPFTGQYSFRKCCLPGEVISYGGACVKHDGVDWSPGNSNYNQWLDSSSFKEHIRFPLSFFCARSTFHTYSPLSSRWERYFKGEYKVGGRYTITLYCNDWQQTYEGHLEEVIGACTSPESGRVLEKVRPLGFVAIMFLVAAAVVAVVREDSRRSAHGRALVCHALSIASYVAIQMFVYLSPSTAQSIAACLPYAYSTYFFITASNWWLMVYTFNVFNNFRKPLGAMAVKGKNDSKESKAEWRRFGVMSLIAWGGASVITAIAIVMHQDVAKNLERGLIIPTFWGTRTCADEYVQVRKNGKDVTTYINHWGTFCYHFLPTTLLIIINLVFVVLTSLNIRKISRGTSILHRGTRNGTACIPWHRMNRVLVYAKLLMMTGFLELVLEIASWTTGFNDASKNFEAWKSKAFIFLSLATFLDVFRGVLVFWLSTGKKFDATQWLIFVRTKLVSAWLCINIRINELARNLKSRRVEPQTNNTTTNDEAIQEDQNSTMKRGNEMPMNAIEKKEGNDQ